MPEMNLETRGHRAGVLPKGWTELYPRRHVYGPPMPPDPWPLVMVGAGAHEQLVPQADALVRQRRQINALAYVQSGGDR